MRKVKLYKGFERFWHWMQALLVIFLILTGFEIHGTWTIFGFERAVSIHNRVAYVLIVLVAFAVFWHFTTGEWRQYLPTKEYLREMILYYFRGIFRGEKHPGKSKEIAKLNPLQRITYLLLKVFLFPVQIATGLLYLFYNDLSISLGLVAILHTLGAFFFMAFLVIHIYLTTTGETTFSNIKAMITGYETMEEKKS